MGGCCGGPLYFEKKSQLKNILLLVISIILVSSGCFSKNLAESNKDNPASKDQIKVALLQLNSLGSDIHKNMELGEKSCRQAKAKGADIVLFPEIWSNGYTRYNWPGSKYKADQYPLGFEEWKNGAIDHDSEFINHFRKLAKELNLAIVITYLEKWEGLPRNSASLIGADGKLLMTYAKVHTSDMKVTESNCTPGDDFFVCDLPLRDMVVKVGIMICFDREFPESARILMLKGAELILTPNACHLDEKQISQFQTRAFENSVAVAMTNYASPYLNGHSCAYDVNGDKILVADDKEGIFTASFNLKRIRDYRSKSIWGNAYRRPLKYKSLISTQVDSIFIRKNGKGEDFNRVER